MPLNGLDRFVGKQRLPLFESSQARLVHDPLDRGPGGLKHLAHGRRHFRSDAVARDENNLVDSGSRSHAVSLGRTVRFNWQALGLGSSVLGLRTLRVPLGGTARGDFGLSRQSKFSKPYIV